MNPSIPVEDVMNALESMAEMRRRLDPVADSVLLTRAGVAEARLRGRLMAALPERIDLRDAA